MRMSISTASAWLPAIRRRPDIISARATPIATTIATSRRSWSRSPAPIASMTLPGNHASESAAARDTVPVLGQVQPSTRARRVGQRDCDRAVEVERPPHEVGHRPQAEQPPRREPADGDDEARAQQSQLPLAPERAEALLLRRRRPVAAAGRRAAGVAARDRRAVERGVELVLLELEPPPEGLAGAAAPRPPFLALQDPRRLPVQIRALAVRPRRDHRERLERVAGLDARAADRLVALQRRERPVGGAAACHSRGASSVVQKKRAARPAGTFPPGTTNRPKTTRTYFPRGRRPGAENDPAQRSPGWRTPASGGMTRSASAPL